MLFILVCINKIEFSIENVLPHRDQISEFLSCLLVNEGCSMTIFSSSF